MQEGFTSLVLGVCPHPFIFLKREEPTSHQVQFVLESVIKTYDNMRVIKLKEYWDSKDSTLVINDVITETGLTSYWLAIDSSFKFNVQKREIYTAKKTAARVSVPNNNANQQNKIDGESQVFRRSFNEEKKIPYRTSFDDTQAVMRHVTMMIVVFPAIGIIIMKGIIGIPAKTCGSTTVSMLALMIDFIYLDRVNISSSQ